MALLAIVGLFTRWTIKNILVDHKSVANFAVIALEGEFQALCLDLLQG